MQILDQDFEPGQLGYNLAKLSPNWEEILFLDIETTGLSADRDELYLIGCAFREENIWHVRQWFSESPEDEPLILASFMNFASRYRLLIHYNGDRFDLPWLKTKCDKYRIAYTLEQITKSIDLRRSIFPYRQLLGLSDCGQKTIEQFLGVEREDRYNGKELIDIYRGYVQLPSQESFSLLIGHNADNVRGMLQLLPILQYVDFFRAFENLPPICVRGGTMQVLVSDKDQDIFQTGPMFNRITSDILPIQARKVQANTYTDYDGGTRREVYMKLALNVYLAAPFALHLDGCYFSVNGDSAVLRVPLYDCELKYFYANYKDYYYLPAEDQAVHKSIAQFVDKLYRVPATADTCYTRKNSSYLREWDLVFSPFFKRSYKDSAMYLELTDEIKKDRSALSLYAAHVLTHLFGNI